MDTELRASTTVDADPAAVFSHFADRTALDVLNSGASKALSERAKKLPGLSRFGTTDPHRQAPDRGHGLGR